MASKKRVVPEPVPSSVKCSVCGLDWGKHEAAMVTSEQEPSFQTCVSLLKAELARRGPVNPYRFAQSGFTSAQGIAVGDFAVGKVQ